MSPIGTDELVGMAEEEEEEDAAVVVVVGGVAVGVVAAVLRQPPGLGVFPSSLHSTQARITSLTVSLIRLQWYLSAIEAVVLLMPPW